MKTDDVLYMNVSFNGKGVERAFEPSYRFTCFGKNFLDICKKGTLPKALAFAFGEVHDIKDPEPLSKLEGIFSEKVFEENGKLFEKQPVPWYLAEFLIALKNATAETDGFAQYSIRVKACKRHYLYSIAGKRQVGDVYELIYPPFFQQAPPPESPEDVEKIRGLADTMLFLAPSIVNAEEEALLESIAWFDIQLDCTVLSHQESGNLRLSIAPKVCTSREISLPPEHDKVLVSSPNVRKAIEKLAKAWINPTAKSVLISAGSGSGKQVLVDLLTDAIRVDREKKRLQLSAPSIESFAKDVEEKIKETGCLHGDRIVVFFDEIHHDAAAGMRSSLLKLIEGNTLTTGKKLDCNPIYVLAASLPPEEIRGRGPLDLWTRIEYWVELRHPLLMENDDERSEVLRDYFKMFWNHQVEEWAKAMHDRPGDRITALLSRMGKRSSLAALSAEVFAEVLGSPLIPVLSIRVLGNVVKRLFGRAMNHLRMKTEATNDASADQDFLRQFRQWVVEIVNELVPEIQAQRGMF